MEEKKTLQEILTQFQGANGDESYLQSQFGELAKYFLYGGYFLVNNKRKVYLRDVEFYYHEEVGAIKDPIMYHRNTKTKSVNYLPVGSFYTHVSGVDITFENSQKEYRASVLIRGFNVLNGDELLPSEYDNRSTQVYEALFTGFSPLESLNIEWKNIPLPACFNIEKCVRKNVCDFDENGNKKLPGGLGEDLTENKKYVQDKRLWRFIRKIE